MKLKTLAAAALIAVSSSSFATTLTFTSAGSGVIGASFSSSVGDTYTFTVGPGGATLISTGVSATQNPDGTPKIGFDITSVTGSFTYTHTDYDVTGSRYDTYTGPTHLFLTAGTYSIIVGGSQLQAGGTGTYNGNVLLAPVPEPETYALMLAGLGAVGFIARRRRNA